CEEGAGEFSPIAIDADFHLHRYSVSLPDGSVGGKIEGAIGQCCARSGHGMHMGQYMVSSGSRVASTYEGSIGCSCNISFCCSNTNGLTSSSKPLHGNRFRTPNSLY